MLAGSWTNVDQRLISAIGQPRILRSPVSLRSFQGVFMRSFTPSARNASQKPSNSTTFQYPGVNLNLRYLRHEDGSIPWESRGPTYPIGLPNSAGAHTYILHMREVAMMMLMERLTDNTNWHEEVFDEAVVRKWWDEVSQQSEDSLFDRIMQDKDRKLIPQPRSRIMTEKAFQFCISELRNKAKYFKRSGLIPTCDSAGNAIVKSDCLIDSSLRHELVKAFDTLGADHKANPKSDDMVQHLVHPSMYPFVYGRSRFIQEEAVGVSNALDFIGQGKTVPQNKDPAKIADIPFKETYEYVITHQKLLPDFWSSTYQWLPANVGFHDDGSAKFTSYVNSLHPNKHPDIYRTLERAIDLAIPAWDQCLREYDLSSGSTSTGRLKPRFKWIKKASDSDDSLWLPPFDPKVFKDADIRLSRDELIELNAQCYSKGRDPQLVEPDQEEEERRKHEGLPPLLPNLDDESLARAKWIKYREALLPEPKEFEETDYTPKQSLREKFKDHGLQVIAKMTSIELTPEKPEFPATTWHIEGQMNEKICATALFCIDSENVTSSNVSFRMIVTPYWSYDVDVKLYEYNYLERVYGTPLGWQFEGNEPRCLQTYGDVETTDRRFLAFPNSFQNRVSSFRLQDPTKPGYKRFLVLWLIDPNRRIISTANVPPQQMDWINTTDRKVVPWGLMTVEEARGHWLKLTNERGAYHATAQMDWDLSPYDFY